MSDVRRMFESVAKLGRAGSWSSFSSPNHWAGEGMAVGDRVSRESGETHCTADYGHNFTGRKEIMTNITSDTWARGNVDDQLLLVSGPAIALDSPGTHG